MSSPAPSKTSHEVEIISVQLQYRAQLANSNSKGAKKKKLGKLETKNKEITFTFELSEESYLSFLSALLKEHGHTKYTPVTKSHRFGIKVAMGAKKTYDFLFFLVLEKLYSLGIIVKKDAVDIDKFTEYSKLVQKIFEEETSKLFVYLSLEDVKMNAKVPSHQVTYYFLATGAWN
jgi:hypothetical protein